METFDYNIFEVNIFLVIASKKIKMFKKAILLAVTLTKFHTFSLLFCIKFT